MFNFGQSATISVDLSNVEKRPYEIVNNGFEDTKRYVFTDGETISGNVYVNLKKPGKKLDHKGISITFVALIDIHMDSSTYPPFIHEFKCLLQPGFITENKVLPFEFVNQKKPYESFYGTTFSIRYILVARILKSMSEIKIPYYVSVFSYSVPPRISQSYYTEIGLKKCILMDLELNKLDFHLNDVIIGRVTWKLINLPIKKMELVIERHEIIYDDGIEDEFMSNIEDIFVYELLDGNPTKGDTIPFRVFLKNIKLTPTIDVVVEKVAVNYYVYISAFDESGRRYFKREQIRLWRQFDENFQSNQTEYITQSNIQSKDRQHTPSSQAAVFAPPFN